MEWCLRTVEWSSECSSASLCPLLIDLESANPIVASSSTALTGQAAYEYTIGPSTGPRPASSMPSMYGGEETEDDNMPYGSSQPTNQTMAGRRTRQCDTITTAATGQAANNVKVALFARVLDGGRRLDVVGSSR